MDDEWTPPTQEELAKMAVRRARSDKVSQIMGQYMLKGYRMLDKQCPICSNVLLQTPAAQGGTNYCVSCYDMEPTEEKPKKVINRQLNRLFYFYFISRSRARRK